MVPCKECIYFAIYANNDNLGECRIYAPQIVEFKKHLSGLFPVVPITSLGCGEGKRSA